MKKIFWFLLGFSLVVFPVRYAMSAAVYPDSADEACILNAIANEPSIDINKFVGFYANSVEANAACGGSSTWNPCAGWRVKWYSGCSVAYSLTGDNYSTEPPVTDTDDDGIPDDCDFYLDDPTPYQYRPVAGQSDGSYIIYITDRGDYYSTGTDPQLPFLDFYYSDSNWLTPTSACVGITDWSSSDPYAAQTPDVPYSGNPDGTPDGGDPTYDTGTDPDGSESSADQKIIANTKDIAENIAKQAAYFKDINANLQLLGRENAMGLSAIDDAISSLDGSVKGLGDQLTGLSDEMSGLGDKIQAQTDADAAKNAADQAEADGAETTFNALNPSTYYNENSMPTGITAGQDYQEHGELGQESFISDFLSSNPIFTAFESSGFTLTGGVCSMTLDLGHLGTHELSLCEFQSEFQTAGVILFGIVSLGSLLIVARGF